jgi:hypothetical protein
MRWSVSYIEFPFFNYESIEPGYPAFLKPIDPNRHDVVSTFWAGIPPFLFFGAAETAVHENGCKNGSIRHIIPSPQEG